MAPKVFIWVGGTKGGFEERLLSVCKILKKDFGIIPTVGLYKKPGKFPYPYKVFRPMIDSEKVRGINNVIVAFKLANSKFVSKFDICIGEFSKKIRPFTVSYVSGDNDSFAKNSKLITRIVYFFIMLFQRYFFKKSNLLIANSNLAIPFIKRRNLGRYFYSPYVVDMKNFKPGKRKAKRDDSVYKLVFIGRDTPQKNLKRLIKAVNLIGNKVHLDVVGVQGKNKKNITYHGWKTHQELVKLLDACDIFVMPSLTETFGIASIEALSMNRPVLLSKYAGAVEDLKEYVHLCGITTEEIETEIRKMIDDYASEYKRAMAGGKFVRKNFDEDSIVKEEIKFILSEYKKKR